MTKSPKHPVESWSRIGVFHSLYWEMCEQAYSTYLKTVADYEALVEEEYPIEKQELEQRATAAGVETIIFAGLCVEAAIYDYAAIQLGDDYVRDHFERMDLLSKWVVIPRLVCGRQLRKGTAAYARLKKLVQSRNRLVHHKSNHFIPNNVEHIKRLEKENSDFEEWVHNAYRALVMLSLEMDDTVGYQFNPLQTFSENTISSHEIPRSLRMVVGECKHVYKRSRDKC